MTLQDIAFNKDDVTGMHVAEFVADGPFNIHLEFQGAPRFTCYQSLTGTGYAPFFNSPQVISNQRDFDFEVPNVPSGMNIKIVSDKEVIVAKIGYES